MPIIQSENDAQSTILIEERERVYEKSTKGVENNKTTHLTMTTSEVTKVSNNKQEEDVLKIQSSPSPTIYEQQYLLPAFQCSNPHNCYLLVIALTAEVSNV